MKIKETKEKKIPMGRKPPAAVRFKLREELGFGCPIPGCGSPFLEWHHFLPPWHVENHHRPEGMIALCHEHHIHADGGAFTDEQLQEFKLNAQENNQAVKANFHWRRQALLAIVGGNFYYENPVILKIKGKNVIWFERDERNNLLLNFIMPTLSKEGRASMLNNEFFAAGTEKDIVCPPSAKKLDVKYNNGDSLSFEFQEINNEQEFIKKYNDVIDIPEEIKFPITTVEISMNVAGSGINFSSKETNLGGVVLRGSWMIENKTAINLQ